MSQKLNELVELSRLRDAGSISTEEFDRLKAEIMLVDDDQGEELEPDAPKGPSRWDQAKQVARDYPRVVGVAAGVFIVAAMVMIYMTGDRGTVVRAAPGGAQPQPGVEAPDDSLGVAFTDLTSMWNELDQTPRIDGSIARSPEVGPFDGFSHKFDNANILAGAYDPTDDAVYALMVRTSLTHPDISNMYLHFCYVLHPFSSECIDAYWEEGLNGKDLEKFLEKDRTASWTFEGNEWRLEIADGVQTLRVISPGSTRVAS